MRTCTACAQYIAAAVLITPWHLTELCQNCEFSHISMGVTPAPTREFSHLAISVTDNEWMFAHVKCENEQVSTNQFLITPCNLHQLWPYCDDLIHACN